MSEMAREEVMRFFKFLIHLILIICCSSATCIFAFVKNNDQALNQDIQKILNENKLKYNLPAISLSIQLPNSPVENYVSGSYSLLENKAITSETLFQIGSITKTFTATILFKLIEQDKINMNDRLEKWLPQYTRWKNRTIRDLLYHTSGFYNYTSGKSFDALLRKNPQKYFTLKELADLAYQHSDLSKPGQKYNYTNTDYILLGMIIEKATHQSIQEVFNAYFNQYRLGNTFYSPSQYPPEVKNRIAHGYNRDGTFKYNTDVTFNSLSFTQSAGAMISTPNDLIKWLHALFNGEIISIKSLDQMLKVIHGNNTQLIDVKDLHPIKHTISSNSFTELGTGAGIGLIYFKNNGLFWVHSGGTLGYESLYAYNPCKGIYLALVYSVKPKQQLIFMKIAERILDRLDHSIEVKKTELPSYCSLY